MTRALEGSRWARAKIDTFHDSNTLKPLIGCDPLVAVGVAKGGQLFAASSQLLTAFEQQSEFTHLLSIDHVISVGVELLQLPFGHSFPWRQIVIRSRDTAHIQKRHTHTNKSMKDQYRTSKDVHTIDTRRRLKDAKVLI